MNAQLILENGKRFSGKMFGAVKDVVGEVVFTTGMIGYQETLTDPSFAGQIVAMTFPLIGNYGINFEDMEAERVSLAAFIVREKCDYPSNFRNEMTLEAFLKQQGIVGLCGIDTRALTKTIRDAGCMKGVIMKGNPTDEQVKKLMAALDNSQVVKNTTIKDKYVINEGAPNKCAYLHLGSDDSVLKKLDEKGFEVSVYPAFTDAEEILSNNPDFLYISNGAGNPEDLPTVVDEVKKLIGKIPVFGMSLGHQLAALALGANVSKLKFGHHGSNQPVKCIECGKVFVTAQNHNYIVSELPKTCELTYVNVNDNSCEGFYDKTNKVFGIQFTPDASELWEMLDSFLKEVR